MSVITEDWFRTTQRQRQAFQSGVIQTKGNRGPERKRAELARYTADAAGTSFLAPGQLSSQPLPALRRPHTQGEGAREAPARPPGHAAREGRGALTQGPGARSCHPKSRGSLPISVTSPFLVPALLMMRPQACIFCFLSVPSASRVRFKTPGTSVSSLGSWSACGWLKPLSFL